MNIAICDDQAAERTAIAAQVRAFFPDAVLSEYESGVALVADHCRHPFDLILLDMLMPIIDGIETAKQIREGDERTPIVFITTSEEYAVQSYRVYAFDYLLKPVAAEDMAQCLARFSAQSQGERFLAVDYLGVQTSIPLENILYLESELHKINIHLLEGKRMCMSGKLDDCFALLDDRAFCRCHKSYIVNLNHVGSISGEDFYMTDGKQIKISRALLMDAKKAYFGYVFGKGGAHIR